MHEQDKADGERENTTHNDGHTATHKRKRNERERARTSQTHNHQETRGKAKLDVWNVMRPCIYAGTITTGVNTRAESHARGTWGSQGAMYVV